MKTMILALSLLVLSPFALAQDNPPVAPGQILSLHTGALSNGKVVAAWNDSFLMIVCESGFFRSSSADLVFQNQNTKEIEVSHYRPSPPGRTPGRPTSPYLSLDLPAVKAICNSPNGYYSLKVSVDGAKAQLLSIDSVEANANGGSRGY